MPYISSGGQVLDGQSPWRLSIISDTFWAIINFVVLFFQTMISPDKTSKGNQYTSDYRPGDGRPPRPPGRRMGRVGGGGGGGAPSPGAMPPGGG